MSKRRGIIRKLFEKHIRHTREKEIVVLETVYVCRLTTSVISVLEFENAKVHINTKILKHLYDKKPAEEFDFIVRHLHRIIKSPDRIYKNKASKRGDFILVKRIDDLDYLSSVEEIIETENEKKAYIVTAFRVRDESYLKKYEFLWSWKGGGPSS